MGKELGDASLRSSPSPIRDHIVGKRICGTARHAQRTPQIGVEIEDELPVVKPRREWSDAELKSWAICSWATFR